jgi:hypothetical protein
MKKKPKEIPEEPKEISEIILFALSPAELFALLTIVDNCNNFGVPWYQPFLFAMGTNDKEKVFEAAKYLVEACEIERLKLENTNGRK